MQMPASSSAFLSPCFSVPLWSLTKWVVNYILLRKMNYSIQQKRHRQQLCHRERACTIHFYYGILSKKFGDHLSASTARHFRARGGVLCRIQAGDGEPPKLFRACRYRRKNRRALRTITKSIGRIFDVTPDKHTEIRFDGCPYMKIRVGTVSIFSGIAGFL